MGEFDIYNDIAERTQGDIYIGVVGPVRTGKSTFIKRFMDLIVIPNIANSYKKERARDTLPQSGSGKLITTVEPKFIPNDEAVEIELENNLKMRVRLVDCVGYMVEGALGHLENNVPRMVKTPWFEEEIEFTRAAEIGTKKVISEHATIGFVVTTDGSITEIPRECYAQAEERVIKELTELKKPFVILLNSSCPYQEETIQLKNQMEEKYGIPVTIVDALNMKVEDVHRILESVLYEFPLKEIGIDLPEWVETLGNEHWLKAAFVNAISASAPMIEKLKDIKTGIDVFLANDFIGEVRLGEMRMGEGTALLSMKPERSLFLKILGEVCGCEIEGEHSLLHIMKELAGSKKEYDKISSALMDARETGYGMVPPQLDELKLEDPEIVKQGNRFGVKLRASAPSLHLIKANVETEVSPIVGTERQSEELIKSLMDQFENDPQKIWQSNMFGKSLEELVKEGLQNKLFKMPEDIQEKLQRTLQKIINEGNGGLICIIL